MRRGRIYLWFICLAASCGGLLFGYDVAVISGIIPKVIEQFSFTSLQIGLLVSCVLWGCAIGAGFGGVIIDAYGRKKVLIITALIMFISAVWSANAGGIQELIIARSIGGIGCGLASTVCPLYISEVSPEKTRGRMVALYHFSVCAGIVACTLINWRIFSFADANMGSESLPAFWKSFAVDQYWRLMFMGEAFPAGLFLIFSFILPESPRWLIKNSRTQKAEVILTKINDKEKARKISEEIMATVKDDYQMSIKVLFSGRAKKNLILAVLLCVFSEACGISAVMYYGPHLLEQAGLSLGSSLGGFAVIAFTNMTFNLVAIGFVDRLGRRKMLGIGAVGSMCSLLLIGTLYLQEQSGFLIILGIIAFIAFFAFSVGPIKFIVISEIFPNKIRGKAVSIATVCIWLTSAAIAQLFPMMRDVLHTGYIFYLFALDLAALLLVVIFLMPETKERTIEEINRTLNYTGTVQ